MSSEVKPPQQHGPDARELAIQAAQAVHDHRAQDVVVLDLRGLSSVTDFFVICSGSSDRQMRAAFDAAEEAGRRCGLKLFGSAGYESATWMLLDFVDVVIHIFAPEYRQYYDLELLWGDAPRLDWNPSPDEPGTRRSEAD